MEEPPAAVAEEVGRALAAVGPCGSYGVVLVVAGQKPNCG